MALAVAVYMCSCGLYLLLSTHAQATTGLQCCTANSLFQLHTKLIGVACSSKALVKDITTNAPQACHDCHICWLCDFPGMRQDMLAQFDARAAFSNCIKCTNNKSVQMRYAMFTQQNMFGMQVFKLQDVLYAMPETSGAVPQAFLVVEELEDEEGIDEVIERPNKRHCNSSCMDLV